MCRYGESEEYTRYSSSTVVSILAIVQFTSRAFTVLILFHFVWIRRIVNSYQILT